MPEMTDMHAIISDLCRTTRGEDGVIVEALFRADLSLRAMLRFWPVGKGSKIHIRVSIEPGEDCS